MRIIMAGMAIGGAAIAVINQRQRPVDGRDRLRTAPKSPYHRRRKGLAGWEIPVLG
jgi:hypothetical protein